MHDRGSGKQHALGVEEESMFNVREYETSINIFSALEIASKSHVKEIIFSNMKFPWIPLGSVQCLNLTLSLQIPEW